MLEIQNHSKGNIMTQAITIERARQLLTEERSIYPVYLDLHGAIWKYPEEDMSNFDTINVVRPMINGVGHERRHNLEVLGTITGAQAKQLFDEGFLHHWFVCFWGFEPHYVLADRNAVWIVDYLSSADRTDQRTLNTINKEIARFQRFQSLNFGPKKTRVEFTINAAKDYDYDDQSGRSNPDWKVCDQATDCADAMRKFESVRDYPIVEFHIETTFADGERIRVPVFGGVTERLVNGIWTSE
jgi:hypothetical protein